MNGSNEFLSIFDNLWQTGLIRTDYIDRSSVYDAFQNAIVGM